MASILANRTVAVLGSGTHAHEALASDVGPLLARLGVNLLTGGGGGVMTSVSRAYVHAPRARGISIGVLPCASETDRAHAREGYPNPYVELAIRTHLPHSGTRGTDDLSRNHINVLTADAIVALPGEHGTASEVLLAVEYGRPIIAYGPALERAVPLDPRVARAASVAELEALLTTALGLADSSIR